MWTPYTFWLILCNYHSIRIHISLWFISLNGNTDEGSAVVTQRYLELMKQCTSSLHDSDCNTEKFLYWMQEEAEGPRGTWGLCVPQSRRPLRNTCLHSTEPSTALWSVTNLDALQEKRYCHTSGQQMRVPPSDSTGSIPRQTIRTFEEVSTGSRTLRDTSNLTANHSDNSTPSAISCMANWQERTANGGRHRQFCCNFKAGETTAVVANVGQQLYIK
jgi:hypothetical protein